MKIPDEILDLMSETIVRIQENTLGDEGDSAREMQAAADGLLESLTVEQLRALAAEKGMAVVPKENSDE